MTTTADPASTLLVLGTYLDEIAEALAVQAEQFTCSEADAIAIIYALTGRTGHAIDFLTAHAAHDEKGDAHHGLVDIHRYLSDLVG